MIKRYTLPEMENIWSEKERFNRMFAIELAVCEAYKDKGLIPESAYQNIKNVKIDVQRIEEIEKKVKHDVIAFIEHIQEQIGSDARYIHIGMTSSDVLDTATAMQLRDSCKLIRKKINCLSEILKEISIKHKFTPITGRTHGIHAEPTTFGLKILSWFSESKRNIQLIDTACEFVSYGKISGAVGNFIHISPDIEEKVCKKLGLAPEPVSTQIVPRDRHAFYVSVLGIIAGSLERIATEIRHLQRTEISELQEPFTEGQKGSSAMPHKRNPIISENICGLARVIRAYVMSSLENIALWHERDISHSSVERIILPDSSILIDFMLERITNLVSNMPVYTENMKRNMEKTKGLIFSEGIMLKLMKKGLTRKDAYEIVQKCAFNAIEKDKYFQEVLLEDETVLKYLKSEEIKKCFDLENIFSNVEYIYKRVIGE